MQTFTKANIPSANISTYVGNNTQIIYVFLKYQSAEELDINIDGSRVAIMFFKNFW